MSIISTLFGDGLKAAIGGLPSIYLWAGGAAAVLAAVVGLRIYWDHSVTKAADARIAQYVANLKKDETDLATIVTKNNTKIQIQYVDRVQVITKVVHDNQTIIDTKVPDINTILSTGWVSAFNFSAKAQPIDPTAASDKTPSGVNADQALDVVNTNNGICLQWKAEVDGWQAWYTTQKAAIAAQNKKDKR
jgi:hypothetical protein